ncbi:MAG: hypothetical protein CMM26_07675 [Rhodospirillaceae bacterium]|nr:hypothetical protein [Rhodospirillaceae bacterium]
MQVPDLDVGRRFYTDFGLNSEERGNDVIFRCEGRDQDQLQLIEGAPKQLHHICFGTTEEEIPQIQAALEKAGCEIIDAPKEAPDGSGLWWRDFEGMTFNVRAAEDTRAAVGAEYVTNDHVNKRRIGRLHEFFDLPQIKPRRLGHVVVFTGDLERKTKLLEETLGFAVSDSVGPFMDFYRLLTGGDHHVVACIQSHAPGLQHVAFEVANADEVHFGGRRMLDKGYLDAWGPGRHAGPGSNLFHYLRDPWSSCVEYFADIDYIPEGHNWEARRYMPGDLPDFCGPAVPPSFNVNFEAMNPNSERL